MVLFWFWWPEGLEFRSDDYLALSYVQDPANVWSDFLGPQYSVPRLALFYRPLITLSIAWDAFLGGKEAFVPLLSNLLVHLGNCILVYLVCRRFTSAPAAFMAMVYWSVHPAHGEAVSWMVGRVDVYSTFCYLLCVHLDMRVREGSTSWRWPALLVFSLGGLTKELCLTLPLALVLLRGPNSPRRLLDSLLELVPYLVVLLLLLALRLVALGEVIGGYEAAAFRLAPVLGFWEPFFPGVPCELSTLAGLFPLVAVAGAAGLWLYRCREKRRLLPALALFVVTALPSAGSAGSLKPRRFNYLPSVAMAGVAALGGPLPPLALLLAQVPDALDERRELRELGQELREQVRSSITDEIDRPYAKDDPFLCWLPSHIHGRTAFAVGSDRLGLPPFHPERRVVLPDRPVFSEVPEQQRGLRITGLAETYYDGPDPLDPAALRRVNDGAEAWLSLGHGMRVVAAEQYEVTFATSLGSLKATLSGEHVVDGRLRVRSLLAAGLAGLPERGLVLELWPAVELSADPRPWVHLVARDRAGEVIGAAQRWRPFPLTRDLWKVLGKEKRGDSWVLLLLLAVTAGLVAVNRRRKRRTTPDPRDPTGPPRAS